jgi:hypothetical protein
VGEEAIRRDPRRPRSPWLIGGSLSSSSSASSAQRSLAGNWDGDGSESIGVFFPPSADATVSAFFLKNIPIAGDWDGTVTVTVTVTVGWFEPSTGTFHLLETNTDLAPERTVVFGGAPDALPIAGKWQR